MSEIGVSTRLVFLNSPRNFASQRFLEGMKNHAFWLLVVLTLSISSLYNLDW